LIRVLLVGISRTSQAAGQPSLNVKTEPRQGSNHKSPRGQFVLEPRMVAQAGLRSDNIAIAVNLLAQRFRAFQLLAGRRQHFDAARVIDLVLGRDRTPEDRAVVAQGPGWFSAGSGYDTQFRGHEMHLRPADWRVSSATSLVCWASSILTSSVIGGARQKLSQ
jgi:hypothetical protein